MRRDNEAGEPGRTLCDRCQREFAPDQLTPHGRMAEFLIGWFERLVLTERGLRIVEGRQRFCPSCHTVMKVLFGTAGALLLAVLLCAALSLAAKQMGYEYGG